MTDLDRAPVPAPTFADARPIGKALLPKSWGCYALYIDPTSIDEFSNATVRAAVDRSCGLLYIGKASGVKTTVYSRVIGRHLNGTARRSTFRFTLGALFREEWSLTPILQSGKPTFTQPDEDRLTAWITKHVLAVGVASAGPVAMEKQWIAQLHPPFTDSPTNRLWDAVIGPHRAQCRTLAHH